MNGPICFWFLIYNMIFNNCPSVVMVVVPMYGVSFVPLVGFCSSMLIMGDLIVRYACVFVFRYEFQSLKLKVVFFIGIYVRLQQLALIWLQLIELNSGLR